LAARIALGAEFDHIIAEKYVEEAVHIEIQFAGDKNGNTMILGERDCSAQRKFQKVIEESPSPSKQLTEETKKRLHGDTKKIIDAVGYENLGTAEYIIDAKTGNSYFMEINPRIQVEHPVTEERIGRDLIELQLSIEEGRNLPDVQEKDNHVMEARVYAEDPVRDFSHDPGKLQVMTINDHPDGLRFDVGYEEGDTVPAEYDKTILKVVATGATREETRELLAKGLQSLTITGVA